MSIQAKPRTPLGLGERGEIVVAARLEQRILGQRPGRYHPDDLAGDDGLGAAPARLCGILRLLADRYPETLADKALQIRLGGVDGHAAHRNVLAPVAPAAGQRNVERLGRRDRVLEEQLVKVAHPVEQEAPRVGLLDGEVLRHHSASRRNALRQPSPRLQPPVPDSSPLAPRLARSSGIRKPITARRTPATTGGLEARAGIASIAPTSGVTGRAGQATTWTATRYPGGRSTGRSRFLPVLSSACC